MFTVLEGGGFGGAKTDCTRDEDMVVMAGGWAGCLLAATSEAMSGARSEATNGSLLVA